MRGALYERLADELGDHPAIRNVARAQRVRLPRPVLLLRPPRPGVPHLAATALRFRRRAQRGLGDRVLEPALPRLRRGDAAAVDAHAGNPGQHLDYRRFTSDAFLDECLEERAMLERCRPDIPVHDQFHGLLQAARLLRLGPRAGCASTDNYPDPADAGQADADRHALRPDPSRQQGQCPGWSWSRPVPVNWRPHNAAKVPGQMRAATRPWPGAPPGCFFSSGGLHGPGPKSSIQPCFPTPAWPPRSGGRSPSSGGSWPGWARSKARRWRPGGAHLLLAELVGRGGTFKTGQRPEDGRATDVDVPAAVSTTGLPLIFAVRTNLSSVTSRCSSRASTC